MTSLSDIYSILAQLRDDLPALLQRKIQPTQIAVGEGLSDISKRLGLIQAGEFRAGNALEPGFGFSGVRIGYPAFTYAGSSWNIAGVSSDVIQFGLDAATGKALAGAGVVTLDANGVTFTVETSGAAVNSAVKWISGGTEYSRLIGWTSALVNQFNMQLNRVSGKHSTMQFLVDSVTETIEGTPASSGITIDAAKDGTSRAAIQLSVSSSSNSQVTLQADYFACLANPTDKLGYFGAGLFATQQTVTGSRGGNAALASLLTALAAYGLIVNSSTA